MELFTFGGRAGYYEIRVAREAGERSHILKEYGLSIY